MSIRNKVVLGMKAVEIQKNKTWKKVSSYFGENTFNASTMKKHISARTYEAFRKWIDEGVVISLEQANEIARAMKDWAVARGATYYTHWFQPLTGLTAEKHDSFISMTGPGKVIENFLAVNSSRASPTLQVFRRVGYALLSRRAAILHGTHQARRS